MLVRIVGTLYLLRVFKFAEKLLFDKNQELTASTLVCQLSFRCFGEQISFNLTVSLTNYVCIEMEYESR